MSGLADPLAVSPRAGVGSPSPFPKTPAEWALRTLASAPTKVGGLPDYVGPFGAWDGDDVESAEEVRAATMQPSVMSHVLAGEKIEVRPRCESCGSVMLRDDHGVSWCPSCISAGIEEEEVPADSEEADRSVRAPLDAHGLAALPVTLRPEIMEYHRAVVRKTFPEEVDEFEMQLGFNPETGAFDAMMSGEVMQMLRDLGPVITIKGRF